jgi:hypothetical protein
VWILTVVGMWVGGNILLFGWLVWQRVIAPSQCSLAQSAVVVAPLKQTSVVLLFAPSHSSRALQNRGRFQEVYPSLHCRKGFGGETWALPIKLDGRSLLEP